MQDFAEWLKINRQREKISLRNLAEKIGNLCSDAFLSQIENRRYRGKKGNLMRPDKEIVIALAKALNTSENEALKLADYAPKNDAIETIDDEFAALFYDSAHWSEENRNEAFENAKLIFKRYQEKERTKTHK